MLKEIGKILLLVLVITVVLVIIASLGEGYKETKQAEVDLRVKIVNLGVENNALKSIATENEKKIQEQQERIEEQQVQLDEQKALLEARRGLTNTKTRGGVVQRNTTEFEATGYCPCSKCNGKWTGQPTASGTSLVAGRTIAVDPNIIPLGSKVTVEGMGEYVAEDTGGAIKGNRIDILFNTHQEALNFGRRKVNVIVGE